MPQKQPPARTAVCPPGVDVSGASTDGLGRATPPSAALARFPLAANTSNAIATTAITAVILETTAEFFVSVLMHYLVADWIRVRKKSYNPAIRVIPSLFAESGRGRDLTMRLDCPGRRQDH